MEAELNSDTVNHLTAFTSRTRILGVRVGTEIPNDSLKTELQNTEADWVELKRSELLLQRKSALEASWLLFIVARVGYLPFHCEALYRYHLT